MRKHAFGLIGRLAREDGDWNAARPAGRGCDGRS